MKDGIRVLFEAPTVDPARVQVRILDGVEAISQLYHFEVHVVALDEGISVDDLMGGPGAVVFQEVARNGETTELRRIPGVVRGVRERFATSGEHTHHEYVVDLVPRAWLTTLTTLHDIFMELTLPEIVDKKLEGAGLSPGLDSAARLRGSYPAQEFVVQYGESDFAFLSRRLEHLGVCFFFEEKDGVDLMVLSDDNSGFRPAEPEHVPFLAAGESQGVYQLEAVHSLVTTSFKNRDYNYRNPAVDVLGEAALGGPGGGLADEYGAHVKSEREATVLARIRSEEAACRRRTLHGRSDAPGLRAGSTVVVDGHPRGDLELYLVEVKHRIVQTVFGDGSGNDEQYHNTFVALPRDVPFRPPRRTPKPVVSGALTGIVEAEAATEMGAIDAEGRYRVAFMYDSVSGRGEGKASRPLRMAQPSAGADRGFHIPLKSGTEVIVTCVNGDPDRPIITGAVPNPQTSSPITAANAEKSGMRTNKSEWYIDDQEPRFKLAVNGEHVLQVGMPNAYEQGFALTTTSNYSSMVSGAMTTVSSTVDSFAKYANRLANKNILDFAGLPDPWGAWQTLELILDGAAAFVGAVSSTVGAWRAQEKAELAAADKAAAKVVADQKKVIVDDLQAAYPYDPTLTYDPTNPALVTNPDGTTRPQTESEFNDALVANADRHVGDRVAANPPETVDEQADAEERYNRAVARRAELQKAADQAAAAKKAGADADAAWGGFDSTVGTINDVLGQAKKAKDAVKAGIKLYSDISKLLGEAAEAGNYTKMKTALLAAPITVGAVPKRLEIELGNFAEPYNIQGAVHSAGLLGLRTAFVHSPQVVAVDGAEVAITSKHAHLKAKYVVEVGSGKDLYLSSNEHIDGYSRKDIRLTAHPSNKAPAFPGGATMLFFAEKSVAVTSETESVLVDAKKNILGNAETEDVLFDSKARNFGAHGKVRSYLGAGGGGGFGLVAEEAVMKIGALASATDLTKASVKSDTCIELAPPKIKLTVGESFLQLTKATCVMGADKITFKSATALVNADKIKLG